MAGTELALVESDHYPVIFGDDAELADIITENFGGDGSGLNPSDLDRIGIPAAGGTSWEVPTLEGSEFTKELTGIILAWSPNRKFWEKDLNDPSNEGGAPPDCFSDDAVVGLGMYGQGSSDNPSGLCANCPKSQWGSKDGSERGPQACREGRLLYMLRPGNILPVVVSLPATSIKPLKTYLLQLTNHQKPYWSVVTTLTLDQKKEGGLTWSVVNAKTSALIGPEQMEAVRNYSKSVKVIAEKRRTAPAIESGATVEEPKEGKATPKSSKS